MFWTVFTSKRCLICVYFSSDSDKTTFFYWTKQHYLQRNHILKLISSQQFIGNTAFHFTRHELMDCSGVYYLWIVLDSHSGGTHWLQRIHCWASHVMLHFSKPVLMKKQTHLHLGWLEVTVQKMFIFGWTITLSCLLLGLLIILLILSLGI